MVLHQSFNLGKTNEIYQEHLKISKITKFGRKMLQSEENIAV